MALDIEQRSDWLRIAARGWELIFEQTGDRWSHRLNGPLYGIIQSVEGTAEELAPPSPAFQELLLEHVASGGCEVQLFGRAGQGVYSAAVRVAGEANEIAFDVFVRGKHSGKPLGQGSTYDLVRGNRDLGMRSGLPPWFQLIEGDLLGEKLPERAPPASGAKERYRILARIGGLPSTVRGRQSVERAEPIQYRWKYRWQMGGGAELG